MTSRIKITKLNLLIIFLIAIIGLIFVLNYIFIPKNVLKYSGLQIYEAIQKYDYLSSRGFNTTVVIKGQDDRGEVELKGEVTEALSGMLTLYTNETCRIIEGLLGTKDVRAIEIYFLVEKPISIEMIYPSESELDKFLTLLNLADKIKGEFAFTTVKPITSTIILKVKNLNQRCFATSDIEVETYSSDFILKVEKPIRTRDIAEMIIWLDEELSIENFQTTQLSLFKGVENKSEIAKFEKIGVPLRIHEI